MTNQTHSQREPSNRRLAEVYLFLDTAMSKYYKGACRRIYDVRETLSRSPINNLPIETNWIYSKSVSELEIIKKGWRKRTKKWKDYLENTIGKEIGTSIKESGIEDFIIINGEVVLRLSQYGKPVEDEERELIERGISEVLGRGQLF